MRAVLGVAMVGLVACVGCGREPTQEEKAITAIEDLGGSVYDIQGIQIVDLSSTNVTDADLAHLKELHRLRQLILDETKITPAGLKQFQQAVPNCKVSSY
ncbi:MAG: hypothetical protein VX958_04910 [Planctomycetota bacterium]|nr:hypothetical protein [Planctomycetota bacterium]